MEVLPQIAIKFRLRNETKGALRYEEVDSADRVVKFASAKIGTLYVRKSGLDGAPARLVATLTVEE